MSSSLRRWRFCVSAGLRVARQNPRFGLARAASLQSPPPHARSLSASIIAVDLDHRSSSAPAAGAAGAVGEGATPGGGLGLNLMCESRRASAGDQRPALG